MLDAVGAAKDSLVGFFCEFRQQIIDSVVEIVCNRGDERRRVHGSVRGGDSQEEEGINRVEDEDDDCINNMADEDDVLCTAYHPALAVAPSYVPPPMDPLIEFDFLG